MKNQTDNSSTGTLSKVKQDRPSIQRVEVEQVTPNELIKIAVENGADVEKLGKLMDLQIRYEDRLAQKAYVEALAKFRSLCPAIFRSKKGHNSMYAPLDKALDAIKPIEEECGLNHTWITKSIEGSIEVICKLTHIGGHSETNSLQAPPDKSGSKNEIQAIGSTTYYLQRYTLFALLGIAPQDMDNDGGTPQEPKSQKQLRTILIKESFENYEVEAARLLSNKKKLSFDKFKAELRSQFDTLSEVERAEFDWTRANIDALAAQMNINNVIE